MSWGGAREGEGSATFPNGDTYAGSYSSGARSGAAIKLLVEMLSDKEGQMEEVAGALTNGDLFGVSVAWLGPLNATLGGPPMLAVGTDMDSWTGAGGVLMLALHAPPSPPPSPPARLHCGRSAFSSSSAAVSNTVELTSPSAPSATSASSLVPFVMNFLMCDASEGFCQQLPFTTCGH